MDDILKHVANLARIFPACAVHDPEDLYEELRYLERCAHRLAEDRCNRPLSDAEVEHREKRIVVGLRSMLGEGAPIFINGDPRGYGLKISDEYMREHKLVLYQDWGGYGIIAPDFEED